MTCSWKSLNVSEVLEELFRSDSGEDIESSPDDDSVDSIVDQAFQQGLDPLLDR